MGLPYSKQIHAAFNEVTPLVASGFDVLRTSRNISILLAAVQILTVLVTGLTLVTLLAILITVNPDLEHERRAIVTPAVRWLASWIMDATWLRVVVWTLILGIALGTSAGWYFTKDVTMTAEEEEGQRVAEEIEAKQGKGKA